MKMFTVAVVIVGVLKCSTGETKMKITCRKSEQIRCLYKGRAIAGNDGNC